VHDNLGNHAGQEILEQAPGELGSAPIVSVFQNLQAVTFEGNISGEVHLVEGLHGDLGVALVLLPVFGLVEIEVVFDGLSGQLDFRVLAGRVPRHDGPVSNQDREGCNQCEENEGLETSTNLTHEVEGNDDDGTAKDQVAELLIARTLRRERSIGNGWILTN